MTHDPTEVWFWVEFLPAARLVSLLVASVLLTTWALSKAGEATVRPSRPRGGSYGPR